MASLGKIEEFNPKTTNINHYSERLEQCFTANEVEADSYMSHWRRAILISVTGGKTYDILGDLCSPVSPSSKYSADMKTILKSQFAPTKLVISEQYHFHSFIQSENTSVSKFATQLQGLATTCNFGNHLNEALRDRFVCGLRSSATQKRLLMEDVNFERALQIVQGLEAAVNDIAHLSRQGSNSDHVHKLHNASSDRYNKSPKPPLKGNEKRPVKAPSFSGTRHKPSCLSCGKQGHPCSNCNDRNFSCHKCGTVGHIGEDCIAKSNRVHAVTESPATDDSTDPFSISLYSISVGQHGTEVPIGFNN